MPFGYEPASGSIEVTSRTETGELMSPVKLAAGLGRARLTKSDDGRQIIQIHLASQEPFHRRGGDPREPDNKFRIRLCLPVVAAYSSATDETAFRASKVGRGMRSRVQVRYLDKRAETIGDIELAVSLGATGTYDIALRGGAADESFRFSINAQIHHYEPDIETAIGGIAYHIADRMIVDEDLHEQSYSNSFGPCWLQNNPGITDASLPAFEGCRITRLDVSDTSVTGSTLPILLSSSHMKDIDCSNSLIDDKGFGNLSRFQRLERLSCCGAGITDSALAALSDHRHLTTLVLSDTLITGSGLTHLRKAPVRSIHLSGCPISVPNLLSVLQIKSLRSLTLDRCGLTDQDLGDLEPLLAEINVSLQDNSFSETGREFIKQFRLHADERQKERAAPFGAALFNWLSKRR